MMDISTMLGLIAVAFMAYRSYLRSSLDTGGIIAASLVGFIHAIHPFRIITLLLAFFIAGTRLTHWGEDIKSELLMQSGPSQKKGRTAIQVLCNSGPATVLACVHLVSSTQASLGSGRTLNDLCIYGIIAQYACSAADTFSSEIGILNDDWPLLITTLRKVPPGTNGAVSVLGLLAALMGGSLIGGVAAIAIPTESLMIRIFVFFVATGAGLTGSLLDSLLGATMQKTVYSAEMKKVIEVHGGQAVSKTAEHEDQTKFIIIGTDLLDNNMVNLVSAILTIILTTSVVASLSLTLSYVI